MLVRYGETLPRAEGSERPEARGQGNPDLLRPGRRWIRQGRRLSRTGDFDPGSAIQRGSVQFLSLGPGDPSTPFGPSIKGAKRLPFDSVEWIPSGREARCKPRHSRDEWEKATGLKRDDYFATIPSPSHQLRHRPRDLEGPGRRQCALGLARRVAAGLPRRARSGGGRRCRYRWTIRSARSGT